MGLDAVAAAVDEAVAAERLRIVATLIRVTGEWELAEDCVQDAVERALTRWPRDGIPDNPAAWLTTTSRHRALDVLKRRRIEQDKLRALEALTEEVASTPTGDGPYDDDRLRLLFACCHPALPMAGRVALTLRTVAGLSTQQIARAFLVSESTMGQRLLRTRTKIANAGISLRVPEPQRLAERTAGVLAVIYLVFNEGYSPTEDGGFRDDLAEEALYLADLVTQLLPGDDEALGLQALLLLQHARRDARVDAAGELLTLEEQDRARWNRVRIGEGLECLAAARATGRPPGAYRLQAEIAALHDDGRRSGEHRLAAHRRGLRRLTGAAPLPRRRAEPRGRGRDGATGPRQGSTPSPSSIPRSSASTRCSRPSRRTSCAGRVDTARLPTPTWMRSHRRGRSRERRLLRRRLSEVSGGA